MVHSKVEIAGVTQIDQTQCHIERPDQNDITEAGTCLLGRTMVSLPRFFIIIEGFTDNTVSCRVLDTIAYLDLNLAGMLASDWTPKITMSRPKADRYAFQDQPL
jgi:hypothetical protein